jgi:hypothetical protein
MLCLHGGFCKRDREPKALPLHVPAVASTLRRLLLRVTFLKRSSLDQEGQTGVHVIVPTPLRWYVELTLRSQAPLRLRPRS